MTIGMDLITNRTFYCKVGNGTGTSFGIYKDNKEYLITARHLFDDVELPSSTTIEIYHDNQWKEFEVNVYYPTNLEIDIAVMTCLHSIVVPTSNIGIGLNNVTLGQDMYFLGFPYNMFTNQSEINRGYPFPFVKKATMSAINVENNIEVAYLDGHNNHGFSGGPVVFYDEFKKQLKIAGVVSGYIPYQGKIRMADKDTNLSYFENSGIIISYSMKHTMEIIANIRGNNS